VKTVRYLGIDPGSRATGYGVIDAQGSKLVYVSSGCVLAKAATFNGRLKEIFEGLCEVIELHQPEQVAIEQVFVAKNPGSALKLGQARGVAIAAALGQQLEIAEYSARTVKKSVVGTGSATKAQVQHMVSVILQLSGIPASDAADALAIAICHVNTCANSYG